jgi:hypothetical protein
MFWTLLLIILAYLIRTNLYQKKKIRTNYINKFVCGAHKLIFFYNEIKDPIQDPYNPFSFIEKEG